MTHLNTRELSEEHVWIRFFLPRLFLSEAVDQYELNEETWGTLGTEFKITVSSWERAKYPKYFVSVQKCWMKYKERMDNGILRCTDDINLLGDGETDIPVFIVNNSDSPKQIFVKTKDSKVMVAILLFPPKTTSLIDKTDSLNALIQAGVPIILWARSTESDQQVSYNTLKEIFCNQKLSELPKRVYEERNAAYAAGELSHIGNHLTLLWDDPTSYIDVFKKLKSQKQM